MTHVTDATINMLASTAYCYAVELHEATKFAYEDELEDIARRITNKLKARLHAALAVDKQLADALNALAFYRLRCELLQSLQSKMRDPERTMVCDVLANGQLLLGPDGQPDAGGYAQAAPAAQVDIVNEALRCAAWLEHIAAGGEVVEIDGLAGTSAAELRRLSAMVDDLRELLQDAKRAMTELHQAAIPDESTEGVPAIIPPAAFRKFVDAHAMLCFCLHQRGHNPPEPARA